MRFLFVDTETLAFCMVCNVEAIYDEYPEGMRCPNNPEEHREFRFEMWLGSALYWERARDKHPEREVWYDFDTQEELWKIVDAHTEPKQQLCMFAHNMGFDIQALGSFHTMTEHGWKIRSAIIDDPPFIVKSRRGSSALLLLDWYNYFRGSLAYAGDLLHVPKHKMPDRKAKLNEWRSYCRNDVRVLAAAVRRYIEFLHTYDLGTFAHTLAGQALNAYRHRFMAYEIFIHTRETVIELERESYYGGRVEMFRRNLLPSRVYSYVDINSAYPAVMANGVFPTKLLSYAENPSLADLEKGITEKQAIAEVVIRTELPLFPVRIEGRLVFPIGEFVTSLATPELQRALREKAVIAVNRIAWYESAPIFAQWVDEIYKLRKDAKQKGDDLWDELLKRMMNSLFGKFGQRSYDWEIIDASNSGPDHIWRELDRDTGRVYTFRRLGNVLQQRRGVEEGFNSFVAIAAHVTSAARMLLLQYIEQAQWRSVYYCDTDSLIIDGSGLIRLRNEIDASRLGALKLESQSKRVRLGAPKNYSFGKLRKHKGKRKNAKNVAGGRYEQEQFVSLVGALRLGWQGGPLIRRITKKDRMTYKKGIVNDDDSISPIRLFRP